MVFCPPLMCISIKVNHHKHSQLIAALLTTRCVGFMESLARQMELNNKHND
jgi:hypothetical protein